MFRYVVAFAAALAVAGCDEDGATVVDAGPEELGRRGAAVALSGIVGAHLEAFAAAADALDAAVTAYAGGAAPSDAQGAWRAAALAWQAVEVMQVGPLAKGTAPGAQWLRDEIYSWPTVSPCRVDQEVVTERYADPGFFDAAVVNVYGLDALEYLLFRADAGNACDRQVRINADGAWGALGEAEVVRRRTAYAAVLAGRLAADARRLRDAWAGFGAKVAKAGDGEPYESGQHAMNDVFRAMFYIDLDVKDVKLDPDGDPADVESPFAAHSKENAVANLRGVQALLGVFAEQLRAEGAGELADALGAATTDAIATVGAVEGPLGAALRERRESVAAAQTAVRRITDLMKTQMVTVLSLSVPQEGAADND